MGDGGKGGGAEGAGGLEGGEGVWGCAVRIDWFTGGEGEDVRGEKGRGV